MKTPSESLIENGNTVSDFTLLDDIKALEKRGMDATMLRMVAGERGLLT